MHPHNQSLVVNHDTFQPAQHGDPLGLDILQQFNTFDFQSFNKVYKPRKFFKAMNKERMKGLQHCFNVRYQGQCGQHNNHQIELVSQP
jgi:hypothetical protein